MDIKLVLSVFCSLLIVFIGTAVAENVQIESSNISVYGILIFLGVGVVIFVLFILLPYNQGYFLRIQKEQTGEEVKKEDAQNLNKMLEYTKKYFHAVGGELGGFAWVDSKNKEQIQNAINRGVKIEIIAGPGICKATKEMFEEKKWVEEKKIELYYLKTRENVHFRVSDGKNVLAHRDQGKTRTWLDGVVAFKNSEFAEEMENKFQNIKSMAEKVYDLNKFKVIENAEALNKI